MRYIFILCFFLGSTLFASAQRNIIESLQHNRAGEGIVTVHQDPRITGLIGSLYVGNAVDGERKVLKTRGYRVQVYAGNNSRIARNEAHNIGTKVKAEFPDMPVYTYFQPPRWLCRVGDFRSIEEADAAMRSLKATGIFKEVSIVREQINIPLD